MGSWANSYHVRSNDPSAVLDAIRTILVESGHRLQGDEPARPVSVGRRRRGRPHILRNPFPTSDDFDEDDVEEDRDDQRNLCVYRAVNGWVGVLDSEPFSDLTMQLSARLKTDTLSVMVNDSDSWLYSLIRRGQPFDEFDSSGEDPNGEGDEMSPELQAALERGNQREIEELIEREMMAHAPSSPIYFPFGGIAPPVEMTFLAQRLREGRGTFRDRLRYGWLWIRYRITKMLAVFGRQPMDFGYDSPRATPLDNDTLEQHIERIREIFPSANVKELRKLLPLNRFPSENLLADFLEIVGLPRYYAYLNYRYLEEHTDEELAEEGIVRVAVLRFQTP